MLAPGDYPPQFHLTDYQGVEVALLDFLRRCRILLLFHPDESCLQAILANTSGLTERDMVALALLLPDHPDELSLSSSCVFLLPDPEGRVAATYGVPPGKTRFFLIGKDGTIKRAASGCPAMAEIFQTVDAMPMRQQEKREQSGDS